MSRLNDTRLVISVPAQRRNTKYTVNIEAVRSLIRTGPANLLLWGDSISSWQANPRLPMGIAMHWPAPNGISGWFMPTFQAATGSLSNYSAAVGTIGTEAQWSYESRAWPFVGFDHTSTLGGNGFTVTDYDDPNSYATDEVLTGVTSPLPKPCRKIVKSGSAWNFPTFHTTYMGPMGVCQSGRCWAAGDWLTGKGANAIRVGLVHLANSQTVTTNQTIYTQEGFGNPSGTATTVVNSITITAPSTATHEVAWASLAAASVSSPFGTVENEPGDTQNPIHFQYKGIGTVDPGTIMGPSQFTAAGNANWAGAFRVALVRDINNTPAAGTNIIPYGIIIEDTTNTTGLYVDNISFSGDTIRTQLDGATVQQMANALTLNAQRPINWVLMQIGENHTTAEWDGGNINELQIRTDLLERIARVNAGWDLAGRPRGLITLVSPWETVGGLKSGSAWYTTVASIMRDIASGNPQISFIDLRQMFADQFSTDELYDAGRNAHMNILFDGVHPSLRGTEYHARFIWNAIMNPVDF